MLRVSSAVFYTIIQGVCGRDASSVPDSVQNENSNIYAVGWIIGERGIRSRRLQVQQRF